MLANLQTEKVSSPTSASIDRSMGAESTNLSNSKIRKYMSSEPKSHESIEPISTNTKNSIDKSGKNLRTNSVKVNLRSLGVESPRADSSEYDF